MLEFFYNHMDSQPIGDAFQTLLFPPQHHLALQILTEWGDHLQTIRDKAEDPDDPELKTYLVGIQAAVAKAMEGSPNLWTRMIAGVTLDTVCQAAQRGADPAIWEMIYGPFSRNDQPIKLMAENLFHDWATNHLIGPAGLYHLVKALLASPRYGAYWLAEKTEIPAMDRYVRGVQSRLAYEQIQAAKPLNNEALLQAEQAMAAQARHIKNGENPVWAYLNARLQQAQQGRTVDIIPFSQSIVKILTEEDQQKTEKANGQPTWKSPFKRSQSKPIPTGHIPRELKIAVLGGVKGGKTSLVKALMNMSDDACTEFKFPLTVVPTRETEENLQKVGFPAGTVGETPNIYRGEVTFTIRDTKMKVTLVDHTGSFINDVADVDQKGDAAFPQIFDVSAGADLLVLVLSPVDIEHLEREGSRLLNHYRTHVAQALKTNPNLMVALMFTKCDQYCLNQPPNHPRFIGTHAEKIALVDYASGISEDHWTKLVDAAAASELAGEAALKRRLMTATRWLWREIVAKNKLNHPFFNAYLVAALPEDPLFKDWYYRGFAHCLEDFFHHADRRLTGIS
ncbi:GTPase domain-containing protein [Acanthopleuribacter pedis]|uniref:Uncharacterized protein n=1 Tax=Acanthopleuribacter pedis TaxID=442870 RepID=A0A8J7U7I4_9BACT|nr:hypothetical protein [Acanthopleuribacter pedis]MBO1321441.1 hypothetical protein [Acanthopleuribacter pedis]